jgi:predicted transcriptional regulator
MTLAEVVAALGLVPLVELGLERRVRWGFCSDLLSDVLAHAQEGDLWITHQRHLNVVAVAKLKGVAAVVCVRGSRPSREVLRTAQEEGVPILSAQEDAFELAGRLYRLLGGEP